MTETQSQLAKQCAGNGRQRRFFSGNRSEKRNGKGSRGEFPLAHLCFRLLRASLVSGDFFFQPIPRGWIPPGTSIYLPWPNSILCFVTRYTFVSKSPCFFDTPTHRVFVRSHRLLLWDWTNLIVYRRQAIFPVFHFESPQNLSFILYSDNYILLIENYIGNTLCRRIASCHFEIDHLTYILTKQLSFKGLKEFVE